MTTNQATVFSEDVIGGLLAQAAGAAQQSILEIGCGDGAHLEIAAKRAWKCFGVEPSAETRAAARARLGSSGHIIENLSDLIPHEFGVVFMAQTSATQALFYKLFSIGAITPSTVVGIATSGDTAAVTDLLQRLHFSAPETKNIGNGALVVARGSDFTEFMRERYVPGTWSKLAEYEHIPRYALAKTLVKDKVVVDFGCGTGYGAAILAETAASVTALDIDAAALAWARTSHRNPRLDFQRHADLGATLPAASFDLVTCFEMIEHVDFEIQKATIASIARLLRQDGVLVISTPNPDVTALYGANHYHLREMNEAEFRDLLGAHFPNIRILRQYVRVGIAIDHDESDSRTIPGSMAGGGANTKPLAFIAVCSRGALPETPNRVLFDHEIDYILQFMNKEQALNKTRLDAYLHAERAQSLETQFDAVRAENHATIARLSEAHVEIQTKNHDLNILEAAKANELAILERRRADELSSPRFLSRHLWHAIRARLRAKFGAKGD